MLNWLDHNACTVNIPEHRSLRHAFVARVHAQSPWLPDLQVQEDGADRSIVAVYHLSFPTNQDHNERLGGRDYKLCTGSDQIIVIEWPASDHHPFAGAQQPTLPEVNHLRPRGERVRVGTPVRRYDCELRGGELTLQLRIGSASALARWRRVVFWWGTRTTVCVTVTGMGPALRRRGRGRLLLGSGRGRILARGRTPGRLRSLQPTRARR
jgi:hypothetical protein